MATLQVKDLYTQKAKWLEEGQNSHYFFYFEKHNNNNIDKLNINGVVTEDLQKFLSNAWKENLFQQP